MPEIGQRTTRTSREINVEFERIRQSITELRSRVETGKIERKFFNQSLDAFQQFLDELVDERQKMLGYERIAKLYNVSRAIGSSLDLQTCLDQVMDAIIELSGAERGFLMMLDDNAVLNIKVARNFDQETIDGSALTLSRTITTKVLETGQALVTSNAETDPRFAGQKSIVDNQLRSIVASPLRVRGQVLGVMYVDNRFQTGLFTDDDLNLLDSFGEQAAIAIDNAIQVKEREAALKAQIQQLKIEIDEAKKQQQVSEIVETDYFQRLSEEAKRLRERGPSHK